MDLMTNLQLEQKNFVESITEYFPSKTIVGVGISEFLSNKTFDSPIIMMRIVDEENYDGYMDSEKRLFYEISNVSVSDAPSGVILLLVEQDGQSAVLIIYALMKDGRAVESEDMELSSAELAAEMRELLHGINEEWNVSIIGSQMY